MSNENEGAPEGQEPGPVPYKRFQEVNAKVAGLTATTEAAKAEAAAAKAAAAEWETKHASAAAEWGTERAIMQRGILDPDGIAVTRTLFDRIPAEARPETGVAGWLASLTPETAPIPLRPYLAPASQPAAHAPAAPPPPSANAGATGRSADNPGKVSLADYNAAQREAQRTGRLAEFVAGPIHKAFVGG